MDFDSFELTPTDHALMGEYWPENLDLSENSDVQLLQTETEKDTEDNSHDDDDLDSLFGPEVDDEPDHGNFADSTPATAFTPSPLPSQTAQLRGEVATSRGALPVKPGVVEQALTTGASGTDAKPPTLCLPTGEPVRGHTDRKSPSTASQRLALPSGLARKVPPLSIATPAASPLRPSLPILSAGSGSTDVERELARASATSSVASAAPTTATATLPTSPEAAAHVAAAESQALRNGSRVQSVLRPASPRAQRVAPPPTQPTARVVASAASSHSQAQRPGKGPSVAFASSSSPSGMTPRIPSVLLPAPQAAPSRNASERATLAASSTAQSGKRKRNATANTAAPAPKRQAVKGASPSSVASHLSRVEHLHSATSGSVTGPSRLFPILRVPSNAPAPQHEAHSTIAARGYSATAPAQLTSGALVSPWSYSMAGTRFRIQIPQPAENTPITPTSVAREPTAAEVAKARTRAPEPPLRLPLQNRWGFYYPDE